MKIRINIKGNTAIIKSTNKVRAKLYEYRGSWVVDSYLIFEKLNKYGIKAVRGPRGITDELSKDLNS